MKAMNTRSSLSKRLKMRRKAFEPAKQPFDLIALALQSLLVSPRLNSPALGRHDRNEAKVQRELARFIPFICPIHDQMTADRQFANRAQQRPTLRSIVSFARRERETYRAPSTRGNHMNFGAPTASGLADGLRSVFFRAPVPSG